MMVNGYICGHCEVPNVKVVNGPAERGLTLVQFFNAITTTQEKPKPYFLQVVEQHRNDFPLL